MSSSEGYYEGRLYPLQDGALKTLAKAFSMNFGHGPTLTGGTALSRAYLGIDIQMI